MRSAEQTGGRRRGGRLTSGGAHPTEMYYRLLKKWVGSICLRHKRGKTVFSTLWSFFGLSLLTCLDPLTVCSQRKNGHFRLLCRM
jgi:hypothetical protein